MNGQSRFVKLTITGNAAYRSLAPNRASALEAVQLQFPATGLAQMAKVYACRKPGKRRFAYDGLTVTVADV